MAKTRKTETNPSSPLFDADDFMRSCTSKKSYDTEWQARFAIGEMEDRHHIVLGFYKCPYCRKFHLTEK